MTTSQTEVESRVTELATQAFKAFCEDISGTFGVDTECEQREILSEIVSGLQKHFENLVAVNIIDSEGILDGAFQFIFDSEGLFTLGGIIAALPEETIMSNRNNASAELAEGMIDAIGEAGNLLAGSWDRVFSEKLEGHIRFSHRLPAIVGKPWDKSEETMGLAGDKEVLFLRYEMTVGSYPAFNCGVIFPKTIFGDSTDFEPEESEQNTPEMQTATEKTDSEESNEEPAIIEGSDGEELKQEQPPVEENPADTTDAGEIEEDAQTEQVPEDTTESENSGEQRNIKESQLPESDLSSDQDDVAQDPNAADGVTEVVTAAPETGKETAMSKIFKAIQKITQSPADLPGQPATGKIFEVIQKMTQSPAVLPGQSTTAEKTTPDITELFEICANDIMQNQITWAGPDDTLQQAFAKMQQTDSGYIMIGREGAIEGIVSKSDITRAMSPYLLPIFAKWRRPLDDATLKIRIKWIMSRPVRTIKPETPLATIIEQMSQFRGRCLPVMDEEGNVQGLVTAFDIFQALLKSNPNTCLTGETAQEPIELAAPAGTK